MLSHGSKRAGQLTTAVMLFAAVRAAADPAPATTPELPAHFASASSVHTDGGTDLRLPPGYFVDEPLWLKLDSETRRLQDAETRLAAENKSLRASTAGWQPGWYTLAVTVAGGVALGWYAHAKL